MPGGIVEEERALFGVVEALGDVDGDALLALGREAVDQKGEVDVVTLRPVAAAVGLERGDLVVQQQVGVVQPPPAQGALAVGDAAAADETKQAPGFVPLQGCRTLVRGVLCADLMWSTLGSSLVRTRR